MRPSHVSARRVGSLPLVMCCCTSSMSSAWREYRTTALESSPAFSSHSRSMLKPAGGSWLSSQSDIAATGEIVVCTSTAPRPSTDLARQVITSSALPWLPASIINSRAAASIHTSTEPCLVNAIGSKASRASSLISLVSFLPGLRPVATSISASRSLVFRLMTELGTTLLSSISLSSHCPPTDSTSAPFSWPRGGTQPTAFSCDRLHSTNRAGCSAASSCASETAHAGPRRYTMTFLNTKTFKTH